MTSTADIPEDAAFGLLLDRTSFYAESGGQENDTGNIVIDGVADFEVTDVQVSNGYVLHIGHLKYGQLEVGSGVVSCYDEVCFTHLHMPRLTQLCLESFDDGHCVATILQPIFSITRLGRFLEITLTNEAL